MPINALEVCWGAAAALEFALAVFRLEAATSVMVVDVFLRLAATFGSQIHSVFGHFRSRSVIQSLKYGKVHGRPRKKGDSDRTTSVDGPANPLPPFFLALVTLFLVIYGGSRLIHFRQHADQKRQRMDW
jgi:hypothetical protein